MTPATHPLPIVVLISGKGTNLQAIIDAAANEELPVKISAVISNRPDAGGLQRAQRAGIPTEVLDHTRFSDRQAFDQTLQEHIDHYQPALIVLAGFMRILGPGFVKHYRGRLVNIHPSLLPAFTGLNTHQRVLDAGMKEHGVSIHFVTDELDGGPVIMQGRIPVHADDTAETLATRAQELEHRMYPQVIRWFAENRLHLCNNEVIADNNTLSAPLEFRTNDDLN